MNPKYQVTIAWSKEMEELILNLQATEKPLLIAKLISV